MPSERLRAPRPRARLVSEPSSALGQAGSPGSGGVHHAGRSAVATATTEPAVRGRWLRLRIRASRLVPAARSALGTGGAARPRRLDRRSAEDQAATGRGELPHPALRALAGGVGPVLPFPQRDLARQRPTRDRRLRREIRPRPGRPGRRVDPARPTAAAAEAGDARHAAAAPRPTRRQARPGRRHPRGSAAGSLVSDVVARPRRGLVADDRGRDRQRQPRARAAALRAQGRRRSGRDRRVGGRIPARCLADAPARLRWPPHPTVRPDRPAVAAGAGQTLGPAAVVERAGLGSRRRAGRGRDHPVLTISHHGRSRAHRPAGSSAARTLSGRPGARTPSTAPQRSHRPAERILHRCPSTSLGHRTSRNCTVLPRRSSPSPRQAAAGIGRAGHDPARTAHQPGPFRRPVLPVDHRHPDALWVAQRLRHHRHRRCPLPALLQPQNAPRRPGPRRHRTRRRDRPSTPPQSRPLAGGHRDPVPAAQQEHRRRPPDQLVDLPDGVAALAG